MVNSKQSDDLLYCQHCGISFLWSTEEQKQANLQAGLPEAARGEQRSAKPPFCPACRKVLPSEGRQRGLVKWINARKQYGFLVRPNADDLFAPLAEVQDRARLQEGDLVEFSLGSNPRGPIAREIRLLTRKAENKPVGQ